MLTLTMKTLKMLMAIALAVTALAFTARADNSTNAPVKPDQLTTCPVSGE